MKTKIYVLKDPITNEVRYVGKTNNIVQRAKAHNNKARDKNTHKRNWINKLRNSGLKPILEVIDEVHITEWKYWEKYYINKYKEQGCNLVNCMGGGEGLTFGNQTSFKGEHRRAVVALDKDGVYFNTFESGSSATSFVGKKGIDSVLSGKTKTFGGYIWLYEENYLSYSQDIIDAIVTNANDNSKKGLGGNRFIKGQTVWNKGTKGIKLKPDKNVHRYSANTGNFIDTWNTAKQAGDKLNINIVGIGQCARGKSKTAGGYIWSYIRLDSVNPVVYAGKTNNKLKNKLK